MQTLENTGGMAEWSSDGRLLLTSKEDRTQVFVWDVKQDHRLGSHEPAVRSSLVNRGGSGGGFMCGVFGFQNRNNTM